MSIIKGALVEKLLTMKSSNSFEYIKNISGATARTLSINNNIIVEFYDSEIINEKNSHDKIGINLGEVKTTNSIRGEIDFYSYNQRFTDKKIYNDFKPKINSNIEIYKLLHCVRSVVLGINFFPGSQKNIEEFINIEKNGVEFIKKIDKGINIFSHILNFFFNKRLIVKKYDYFFTRKEIMLLNELKKNLDSHFKFSPLAQNFSNLFYEKVDDTQNNEDSNTDNDADKENNNDTETNNEKTHEFERSESEDSSFKEIIENIENINEETDDSLFGEKKSNKKKINKDYYSAYTKKHDLIINASNLAERDELNLLKKKLDDESPKFDALVNKLSIKLERRLMANKLRSWEFDLEEGILDSSKLTRIILNPNNNLTFKKEIESNAKNTVVSLLLDNSGSMRGRPIMIAANAVEILSKTLERCGVKVEILGFTTKEWKGGNSKIDWANNNKPKNPGRLNDLLHIIYKSSEVSWKNCSKNLGLVLKDGLLKENIDGEALVWANHRLLNKDQKRKILIIISDGAPVDDSTLSTNNSNLLESHLKTTVQGIQEAKNIEILAIGIGHDVSKYYDKAFTIQNADNLAETMLSQITGLFSKS
jgi:cobaltochelatase CobT